MQSSPIQSIKVASLDGSPLSQHSFTKDPSLPTDALYTDGKWFRDENGRVCMLRGVNLSGNCKLPFEPYMPTHEQTGFFDHRHVSFVGRPFPLDEADEHLQRLRHWVRPHDQRSLVSHLFFFIRDFCFYAFKSRGKLWSTPGRTLLFIFIFIYILSIVANMIRTTWTIWWPSCTRPRHMVSSAFWIRIRMRGLASRGVPGHLAGRWKWLGLI